VNEIWNEMLHPEWLGMLGPRAFPVSLRLPLQNQSDPYVPMASGAISTPISSPPEGGLFSALNAGTSGGLLGNIGSSIQQLASGKQGNFATAPPRIGMGRDFRRDVLIERLADPQGRSSWNAAAGLSDARLWPNGTNVQIDQNAISDVTPDNSWIPNARYAADGHHHVPRAVYEKLPLQDETRSIFNKGTTGPLPWYGWHQNDALHRAYSEAVAELVDRYMQENNIKPEEMTPEQARAVLKATAESEEPRIRTYREMIKRMWMFYRLRSGARGNE
jgi:hypothetical protein